MKKILICTANYYTSKYQVGIHHYARAFEKLGYEVAFVSDPISSLHFVFSKSNSLKERDFIYKKNGIQLGSIWYYVPKSYISPQNKFLLSSKYLFENWHKLCKISLLNILKKKGFDDVDILWCESPLYEFIFDEVKYKKSILRLADYSKGLNNSWQLFYDKEIEIANKVDRIIYTGKTLYNFYTEILDKTKMVYIPNGIDMDLVLKSDRNFPHEFNYIPNPRVLYIGMIDTWFDINIVYESALKLSQFSFILIGDSNIDLLKLKKLKNIFILGSKPHYEISKYLSNSDIGIIPFKRDDFVDSINPVKLYEYAAYGLNVVSTQWKEIESLNDYFSICKDKDEFISELLKYSGKDDVSEWIKKQDWKLKAIEAIKF